MVHYYYKGYYGYYQLSDENIIYGYHGYPGYLAIKIWLSWSSTETSMLCRGI